MPDRFIDLILKKRYEIQEFLGSGGWAFVFKAHDHGLDRQVAVKIVQPRHALLPEARDAFIKEARLIAQLEHSHILIIYDQDELSFKGLNLVYLAMQLARGGALRDRLEGGGLTLHVVNRILSQICAALDYAHNRKVLHLDLKPENILFDELGNALVADFGLAKVLETSHVKADTYMGTRGYRAPEQYFGRDASRSTDIYTLGITLYEMLMGHLPDLELTREGRFPRLDQLLLSEVRSVIKKATQSDPAQRYRMAGELARAFGAVVSSLEPDQRFLTAKELAQAFPVAVSSLKAKLPTVEEFISSPSTEESSSPWRFRLRRVGVLVAVLMVMTGLILIGLLSFTGGGAFTPMPAASTASPSPSPSPTAMPTATATPTPSPPSTPTPTATATPTLTPTPYPSPTDTPSLTPTPSPTPFFTVRLDRARVYTGPGEHCDVLGEIRRGDQLPVLGKLEDGTWLQVDYLGREGWVRAQSDPNIDIALLPIVQAPSACTVDPIKPDDKEPTPLGPNTVLSLENPDFERIGGYVIPGWTWLAEDNYSPGEDYDPSNSFDTPLLKQADDPSRTIHGPTLQIDAAAYLKFKVYVFQTVAVPPSTTVRFQALASAYADTGDIEVAAGIDPAGGSNCGHVRWGVPWMIDQRDGVVQVVSPDVVVGPAGHATVCLYAETLYPASHNAAFLDSAKLIGNPQ
jgi:serine/threonine-protein kinase